MTKYNHAYDIAFEVISEDPKDATKEQIFAGLLRRTTDLLQNGDELLEAVGMPSDTYEIEEKT